MTRALIQEITDGPAHTFHELFDEAKDKAHHLVEDAGETIAHGAEAVAHGVEHLAHGVEHFAEGVRHHTKR